MEMSKALVQFPEDWQSFGKRLQSFISKSPVGAWPNNPNAPKDVRTKSRPSQSKSTTKSEWSSSTFVQETGQSRFSPRRPARGLTSPRTVRRGTFGSRQVRAIPSRIPWDDEIPPPASSPSTETDTAEKKSDASDPANDNYHSDDQPSNSEEDDEAETSPLLPPRAKRQFRRPLQEELASDDEGDDFVFDDGKSTEPGPVSSQQLAYKKRRILIDNDDDSDEEEAKIVAEDTDEEMPSPSVDTTTPAATRAVSPASRTGKISSFFLPKTKALATRKETNPSTPPRSTQASASKQKSRSANRNLSTKPWIMGSPAGRRSRESAVRLFGTNYKPFASDSVEPDGDPIEEYSTSTTNSPQRTKPQSAPRNHIMSLLDKADRAPPSARELMTPTVRPKGSRASLSALADRIHQISDKESEKSSTSARSASLVAPNKADWKGLRNLGNTCYLNASVQLLATLPPAWWAQMKRLVTTERPLTETLVQTRTDLLIPPEPSQGLGSVPAVNPQSLKQAMDKRTDKYVGYEQRDAHEFVSDLLDFLHEETLVTSAKHSFFSKLTPAENQENRPNLPDSSIESGSSCTTKKPTTTSPTEDFSMTVQACLTCQSCGYARTKDELYRHMSVDIPTETSAPPAISSCVADFFEPEIRELICEKCSEGREASQSLTIVSRYARDTRNRLLF